MTVKQVLQKALKLINGHACAGGFTRIVGGRRRYCIRGAIVKASGATKLAQKYFDSTPRQEELIESAKSLCLRAAHAKWDPAYSSLSSKNDSFLRVKDRTRWARKVLKKAIQLCGRD